MTSFISFDGRRSSLYVSFFRLEDWKGENGDSVVDYLTTFVLGLLILKGVSEATIRGCHNVRFR